jgi:chaperone BCS1
MFHGLPGTGKTSLIRALASHFGYHLCMVKHSQKMDDNSLENMLTRIKEKSFLVFEDIDSIFQAREVRSANYVSYSGILNMLDGIGNYDKLIVFITTNRLQQLDAAFKRRVDLFVEFGYVRKGEAMEMFNRFFADAGTEAAKQFWEQIRSKSLTTNMLEKYFMHCLRKQVSAMDALDQLDDYAELTQDKAPSSLYQ